MTPAFVRLLAEAPPLPLNLQIETTTRCNLRCIMCPKGAPGEVMGDLDLEVLDRIGGLISGAWEVRPHGFGEAFLSRGLEKVLRRCAGSGAWVAIVSNGTLIDERRAKLLVDVGVQNLIVSIDAADPDLFYAIRKTRLSRIVENLAGLDALKRERGVREPCVTLQTVGMSNNLQDLPRMVELAASVGAEAVSVVAFTEFELEAVKSIGIRSLLEDPEPARARIAEARRLGESLGVRLEIAPAYRSLVAPPEPAVEAAKAAEADGAREAGERAAAEAEIAAPRGSASRAERIAGPRLSASRAERIAGLAQAALHAYRTDPVQAFRKTALHLSDAARVLRSRRITRAEDASAKPLRPAPERVRCTDPWDLVHVNHKADVNPCCMSQRPMGNLREQSFEEIWNGDTYRTFREKLLSSDPPEECRGCSKAGWYQPYELEDWMEVGRNDHFGTQLGTGWCDAREGARLSREEAILRLRNSGKRRLRLTMALWSDPRVAKRQRGEVLVNDQRIGSFELSRQGPHELTFVLPKSDAAELLVRVRCARPESEDPAATRERWPGIALSRARLVS